MKWRLWSLNLWKKFKKFEFCVSVCLCRFVCDFVCVCESDAFTYMYLSVCVSSKLLVCCVYCVWQACVYCVCLGVNWTWKNGNEVLCSLCSLFLWFMFELMTYQLMLFVVWSFEVINLCIVAFVDLWMIMDDLCIKLMLFVWYLNLCIVIWNLKFC